MIYWLLLKISLTRCSLSHVIITNSGFFLTCLENIVYDDALWKHANFKDDVAIFFPNSNFGGWGQSSEGRRPGTGSWGPRKTKTPLRVSLNFSFENNTLQKKRIPYFIICANQNLCICCDRYSNDRLYVNIAMSFPTSKHISLHMRNTFFINSCWVMSFVLKSLFTRRVSKNSVVCLISI